MNFNSANTGAAHVTVRDGDIVLTTIDHFCDREAIEKIDLLDFIKLDVEGFELFVLSGGEKTIRHSKSVILMELNPKTAQSMRGNK